VDFLIGSNIGKDFAILITAAEVSSQEDSIPKIIELLIIMAKLENKNTNNEEPNVDQPVIKKKSPLSSGFYTVSYATILFWLHCYLLSSTFR
jgi:hypothetical protein